MPQIEESIEIAAARADVFKFCHDFKSRPEWDEQVAHIELLTPKPIRRGTLLRIDSSQGAGAVYSWDAEVVEYQLPQGSTMRVIDSASSSPFGRGSKISWEFSSVGSGTRFTWVWDYRHKNILSRIVDFLGRRAATQRAIKRSLTNLKAIVEGGRRASVS